MRRLPRAADVGLETQPRTRSRRGFQVRLQSGHVHRHAPPRRRGVHPGRAARAAAIVRSTVTIAPSGSLCSSARVGAPRYCFARGAIAPPPGPWLLAPNERSSEALSAPLRGEGASQPVLRRRLACCEDRPHGHPQPAPPMITPIFRLNSREAWRPQAVETAERFGTSSGCGTSTTLGISSGSGSTRATGSSFSSPVLTSRVSCRF